MPSIGTAISIGTNLASSALSKKGGGGGGGGGAANAYMTLPSNIRSILDSYFTKAQDISNTPYQEYSGDRIAPLSTDELAAIDYGRSNFGQTLPTIQGANALNQQLIGMASEGPTAQNLQKFMNPYQQLVVDQAKTRATEDFQNTLKNIRNEFVNAGAYGGTRQGLKEGLAYRDLNRNLTDIQERGLQQGYTNAQDQFFKTLQTSGDLNQQAVQTATTGQNAVNSDVNQRINLGQLQRAIEQANMDQGYQDWANRVNFPVNQLNVLGTAFSNVAPYFTPYGTQSGGGSSGSTAGGIFGNLANRLGGLFGGGGGNAPNLIGMNGSNNAGITWYSKGGRVKANGYAKGGQVKKFASGGRTPWDEKVPTFDPVNWLESILNPSGKNNETDRADQTSAKGIAEALFKEVQSQREIDKFNASTLTEVGNRLAQNKFRDLMSPYAEQVAQATGFLGTSRGNLFPKFQNGGQVRKPQGSIIDKTTALMRSLGLDSDAESTVNLANLINNNKKTNQAIGDFIFGYSPSEDTSNQTEQIPSSNKRTNEAKVLDDINKSNVLDTGTKLPQQKEVMSPGVQTSTGQPTSNTLPQNLGNSSLDGDILNIKKLMESFGLDKQDGAKPRKSGADIGKLAMAMATSGLMSPGQIETMAMGFLGDEVSQQDQDEQTKDQREQKNKNLEATIKLQDLLNAQDYARIQRMFALQKAAGGNKEDNNSRIREKMALDTLNAKLNRGEKLTEQENQIRDVILARQLQALGISTTGNSTPGISPSTVVIPLNKTGYRTE